MDITPTDITPQDILPKDILEEFIIKPVIMSKELNLCEILKGHEGETFYSPLFGNITLAEVREGYAYPLIFTLGGTLYYFTSDGKLNLGNAECLLFPSKDQRDWNKWIEEQKPKVPKTWSECIIQEKGRRYHLSFIKKLDGYCTEAGNTPIEKSALALLKIHQLIEVGYGGNVNFKDTYTDKFGIYYNPAWRKFVVDYCTNAVNHIAFHTEKQAEEFLKYTENIQLLKDYFMV